MRPCSKRWIARLAAAVASAIVAPCAVAASCEHDVRDPGLKRLTCRAEAVAEGADAAGLKRYTLGLVNAYKCAMDLDIALDALDQGRVKSVPVNVPGQAFVCEFNTAAGLVNAAGKMSATVASQGGKVTDVNIRLDEMTGLKRIVTGALKLLLASRKFRLEAAQGVEGVLAARAAKR